MIMSQPVSTSAGPLPQLVTRRSRGLSPLWRYFAVSFSVCLSIFSIFFLSALEDVFPAIRSREMAIPFAITCPYCRYYIFVLTDVSSDYFSHFLGDHVVCIWGVPDVSVIYHLHSWFLRFSSAVEIHVDKANRNIDVTLFHVVILMLPEKQIYYNIIWHAHIVKYNRLKVSTLLFKKCNGQFRYNAISYL